MGFLSGTSSLDKFPEVGHQITRYSHTDLGIACQTTFQKFYTNLRCNQETLQEFVFASSNIVFIDFFFKLST